VVCHAKVVIGTKIYNFLSINDQPSALCRAYRADAVVSSTLLEHIKLFLDPMKFVAHNLLAENCMV
jgi:hypothetical protein